MTQDRPRCFSHGLPLTLSLSPPKSAWTAMLDFPRERVCYWTPNLQGRRAFDGCRIGSDDTVLFCSTIRASRRRSRGRASAGRVRERLGAVDAQRRRGTTIRRIPAAARPSLSGCSHRTRAGGRHPAAQPLGSLLTRRWRKGASNCRSRREGEAVPTRHTATIRANL